MKPYNIEKLVYDQMFPKPKPTDPNSFNGLASKSLIPEVRMETHAFYGHLDTQEAKYPGLDYSNKTHRIRLARYPWHRRLFRAFDALRLTESEIAGITKWEGTRWAKEKYEREQGVKIRDSTADEIPMWVEPEDRAPPPTQDGNGRSPTVRVEVSPRAEHAPSPNATSPEREVTNEDGEKDGDNDEDMDWMDGTQDEDDTDDLTYVPSVGNELNQRLRQQAARRHAGLDPTAVMDEEWEQWFKQAMESGSQPARTSSASIDIERMVTGGMVLPLHYFPETMVANARRGAWTEVPGFLHDALRRALRAERDGIMSERELWEGVYLDPVGV